MDAQTMRELTEDDRWNFANEIADYVSIYGVRLGFTDAANIIERLVSSETWADTTDVPA